MNILLIFFALPIAVIIISIALQRILKCPWLVAAIIFAIFLIVTFIVNNLNFLIAAIVFAIIAFITAFITCLICRILNRIGGDDFCCCRRRDNSCCCRRDDSCRRRRRDDSCNCRRRDCDCCDDDSRDNNFLTISNNQNDVSNFEFSQNNNGSSYQITNSDGLSARINIIPNASNNTNNNVNNGNTNGCSCCRRR